MLIKIILLLRMDRFIRYHQKIFRKKNILDGYVQLFCF